MNSRLLLIAFFLFPLLLFSQSAEHDPSPAIPHPELPAERPGEIILHHAGYTVSYNPEHHVANWVAYELTAGETYSIVKRNNRFIPDPLLSTGSASTGDYTKSGYDRGHLAPAADMCWSYQSMTESFYLTNIAPQVPAFNRGIWEQLERKVREWAVEDQAAYVVTGTIVPEDAPVIGAHRIAVPAYFYKVVVDCTEPGIKGVGFILPNAGSGEPLQNYAVTIDSVENVTGLDFFYQLPLEVQEDVEGSINLDRWSW